MNNKKVDFIILKWYNIYRNIERRNRKMNNTSLKKEIYFKIENFVLY